MGIFARTREILSANINAMLDKAEDPEKMVRFIVREMDDALLEVKGACAQAIANRRRVEREREQVEDRVDKWKERAELAVKKGREDLAREALRERQRLARRVETLDAELGEWTALVGQYEDDIRQLEEKLQAVLEKQRLLVQRHRGAKTRKQAQTQIRKLDTSQALLRFERLEQQIDRMEGGGDVPGSARRRTLEEEFADLAADEEIEQELESLKQKVADKSGS